MVCRLSPPENYNKSQDNRAVVRWITWGAGKGGRVIVPIDASGNSWYGFTAE
jgi:hypothetical protein